MTPREFLSFTVQPSYGQLKAGITWNVRHTAPSDAMLLFRSINGGNPPWTRITSATGVPVSSGYFVDDISVTRENTAQKIFYRGCVLAQGGGQTDGPVVSFCSWLAPNEVRHVERMLRNEMRIMHTNRRGRISGGGILAAMFAPLEHGTPNPDYDSSTKQFVGQGGLPGANDSYGMPFIGGFGPQMMTWVRFVKDAEETHEGTDDQPGDRQGRVIRARLLAFPRPSSNYMIVQPATDDRFIIGSKVDTFYYKGILPFAYEAEIVRLERSDPRYRLPVKLDNFPY